MASTLASCVRPEWVKVGYDGKRRVARETLACWVDQRGEDLLVADHFFPWLLFLTVLPPELDLWQAELQALVGGYSALAKSREDWPARRFSGPISLDGFGADALMGAIVVDVVRTSRLLYALPPAIPPSPASPSDDPLFEKHEHFRRIERLLFVFGSSIGNRYCQGFNELASVLYLAIVGGFWTGECYRSYIADTAPLDQAEALTYWCFQKLMAKCDLLRLYGDDTAFLDAYLCDFQRLLSKSLPGVADVLAEWGITPLFYAIRWFTLMFAQEHQVLTLLWIWDEILMHADDLLAYLKHMALAHLEAAAQKFQAKNYAATLQAVQRIKIRDIRGLRIKATLSWRRSDSADGSI
jgi:hypothetical protein